nr:hypothetical protein [uncultured Allomuricauda sp.]
MKKANTLLKINTIIEMPSIILADIFFLFFKDNMESITGIKNNTGNISAKSPGKSFQIKEGLPTKTIKKSNTKNNRLIMDILFNMLLLFFILLLFDA